MLGTVSSAALGAVFIALFAGCGGASPAATQTPMPMLTCTTQATPDLDVASGFDVDTGLPPSTVGAGYGQAACEGQYLVQIELAPWPASATSFEVSGFWSSNVPQLPCEMHATMNVFGFDGSAWAVWDAVSYVGMESDGFCIPEAEHTNAASEGYGVTQIPPDQGFVRARVAVAATIGSSLVPVAVSGSFSYPY